VGDPGDIGYRIRQLEKHAFPLEVKELEQCTMSDEEKTRSQLIEELAALREEVTGKIQQEQRKTSQERIRDALWNMSLSQDIYQVLQVLYEELKGLCPVFDACSVQVVNEGKGDDVSYQISEKGVQEIYRESVDGTAVEMCWREQRVVYRPDLRQEDPYQEADLLWDEEEGYSPAVRAVLDVPFFRGTLAINSAQPNTFFPEDIEILQEFATMLSEGFRRMEDLQSLEQRNRELEEKDGLLTAFQQIAQTALSSLDLDHILDHLATQIIQMGIFRSLAISLVDEKARQVTQVRSVSRSVPDHTPQGNPDEIGINYSLDDKDILAETARTGEFQVAIEWDERLTGTPKQELASGRRGQVAYFIPVKREDRVLAVLATGSTIEEKEAMLHQIQVMQPLLDQIAITLEHARLYRELQEKERLLTAFQQIAQETLSSLDREQMLGNLARQITQAGLFRSLMVALVDEEEGVFWITEDLGIDSDGQVKDHPHYLTTAVGRAISIQDPVDWGAQAIRQKKLLVQEGWGFGLTPHSQSPEDEYKVAFFLPIVGHQGKVRALLGTAGLREDREAILSRIEMMQSLLDEVAIALEHARLFEALQKEITERQQAEEAVRKERDRAQHYLDIAGVTLVALDKDGCIMLINRCGLDLLGYEEAELIGRNWFGTCLPEKLRDDVPGIFKQLMAGEVELVEFYENPVLAKGGQERVVAWHNSVLRNADGSIVGTLSSGEDVTERRQLEEERIHTQRLRAIGELAAGVSHNLNNMLTGVLGPAQLLEHYSDDPRVLQEAEEIIAGALRARDLVLRLNQAVRGADETERVPVPINQVIQDAIQVARPRWKDEAEGRGIAIEVATSLGDVPTIRGTGTGLHDILLNLLFNAVDAMPEGGTITIDTQSVDDGVGLTVCDTGTGMEEETRRRVFEPLFTTKMDVGSGLGLSTAHGMVESWGGCIEVESAPGQGTTFTLWFPAWNEPEAPSQDAAVAGGSSVRRGRLLVAEDDESVCHLLESLLAGTHEVEIVLDGREALEGFTPGWYDVVLIDLGLPGMSGEQVAREMMRVDPAVVTVLITGWTLQPDDVRLHMFDFHLPKPFDDLDEVERVVARAIELHDERIG
jgi:two-component system, cell cycle sensor histidine kinase and response regulator CckA